jgi:hypothetical protein
MRAWLWATSLAIVAACSASCGGNVIVDGAGAATTGTGASGGSSGAGGGTGTTTTCQSTCLEAIKEGGGVCPASMSLMAYQAFTTCAAASCGGACGDIDAGGASAACLGCMSVPCANPIMVCTGS